MSETIEAPEFGRFRAIASETSGSHVYDFLGTATRVAFKQSWATHALPKGRFQTPGLPPKNEHYLDWVALLRAVARAKGTFRMAELGAGWGPWLVRAAFAAKQQPQIAKVELLGVEADPTHFGWMRQHFMDNGLNPDGHILLNGAAAGKPGMVSFPVIENPDEDYGASIASAARAQRTITVQAYTLTELLNRFLGVVDFVHVDIQGAEYEALPLAMDVMTKQVRSVMVGTHTSDAMHEGLVAKFKASGWMEIINLPRNRAHETPWGEIKVGDGFLLFDNPRLS
jgi:FkbM family methyltransferase